MRAGDVAGVAEALEALDTDTLACEHDLDADGHLGTGGALHLASFMRVLSVVPQLLLRAKCEEKRKGGGGVIGAALNTSMGATVLFCAAQLGHTATATLLLDRGSNVGAKIDAGWTALVCAAHGGHVATVAVLVFFGLDHSLCPSLPFQPIPTDTKFSPQPNPKS